jgi:hypothetical protein
MEPVPIVGRLKLFDVDWPALLAAHRRTIEAGQ